MTRRELRNLLPLLTSDKENMDVLVTTPITEHTHHTFKLLKVEVTYGGATILIAEPVKHEAK